MQRFSLIKRTMKWLKNTWILQTLFRPQEHLWFLWIALEFIDAMFAGANVQQLLPVTYSSLTCDSSLRHHLVHQLHLPSLSLTNFTLKLWSARHLLSIFIQSLDGLQTIASLIWFQYVQLFQFGYDKINLKYYTGPLS